MCTMIYFQINVWDLAWKSVSSKINGKVISSFTLTARLMCMREGAVCSIQSSVWILIIHAYIFFNLFVVQYFSPFFFFLIIYWVKNVCDLLHRRKNLKKLIYMSGVSLVQCSLTYTTIEERFVISFIFIFKLYFYAL